MADARVTFAWLAAAPETSEPVFAWLGQVQPTEAPPPTQTRSSVKKDWTRVEMIMIGSLVLNAIWLSLYASNLVRSRRVGS